jgi:hypothetical protein
MFGPLSVKKRKDMFSTQVSPSRQKLNADLVFNKGTVPVTVRRYVTCYLADSFIIIENLVSMYRYRYL